jgi:hypothetical protein
MRLTHKNDNPITDWQAKVNRRALERALPELTDPQLEDTINVLVERLEQHFLEHGNGELLSHNAALTTVSAIFSLPIKKENGTLVLGDCPVCETEAK